MAERSMGSSAAWTLTLLRVVTAFEFMQHGTQKLFGWLGGAGGTGAALSFPQLPWFGGVLEVFGGVLILFGLFTRPVAFLLSGEMAVAYFKVHAPMGFWPVMSHGEVPVLLCFIFLFFSVHGAGPYSLDRMFRR